jgi:hypothetical protein
MAVTGLLIAIYISLEVKKPAEISNSSENWIVELYNKYHTN